MKKLILLMLLAVAQISFAQRTSSTYYYYSETEYTYGPYYFSKTMGLIQNIINHKRRKEAEAEFKKVMLEKTTEMRTYYNSMDNYPSAVPNGWHDVTIMVGNSFIDHRKVRVENNVIKEVIWNNWMPEPVAFSGPIQKCKSAIQYKEPKGHLKGLVEVYFMNTITDSTSTTTEPLEPAMITFWTSLYKYDIRSVSVNDRLFGPFGARYDDENAPECGDFQSINVYVKPGVIFYFKSLKTGFYSMNSLRKLSKKGSKISLQEGECRLVEITRKN